MKSCLLRIWEVKNSECIYYTYCPYRCGHFYGRCRRFNNLYFEMDEKEMTGAGKNEV